MTFIYILTAVIFLAIRAPSQLLRLRRWIEATQSLQFLLLSNLSSRSVRALIPLNLPPVGNRSSNIKLMQISTRRWHKFQKNLEYYIYLDLVKLLLCSIFFIITAAISNSSTLKQLIFFYFKWRLITLQYYASFSIHSHESTMGVHVSPILSPIPNSLPHPIPLGCPSTPAMSVLFHALNLDWSSISHMVIYMFQYYSRKSSHPRLFPQSPKLCSLHLCLFCCLTHRVIVTIFLNSIHMC